MSQCVPSWDVDDNHTSFGLAASTYTNSSNSLPPEALSLDYEVAELTWENGQLAMHGLAPTRVVSKPADASSPAWEKPRAGGTLESIVNQATVRDLLPKSAAVAAKVNDLAPWFDHRRAFVNPGAAAAAAMDALVPCNNTRRNDFQEKSGAHVLESVPGNGTCMVGSCSGSAVADGGVPRRRGGSCRCSMNASVSESATCGGDSRQVTLESSEREFVDGGLTSTSLWSPENTSSGGETKTSGEEQDYLCRSRSQREVGEKGKKKGIGKNSISAKSRAAAIHNQSERKRRDKINQRMKTLQKLVPNSSKTDKASMLDEVIEYLKQLQAQVQMMSRMNMPMMFPLSMQQQLQMSMMAQAMGMGMGHVMDINNVGRAAALPPAPVIPAAAAFMPMPAWDIHGVGQRLPVQPVMPEHLLPAFIASQSQPNTIDSAYTRLAAMYQQFLQPHLGSASKN